MWEAVLEEGATYGHVFGGGEVNESKAVFVGQLVCAELSNNRSKFLLLANLSVEIPDDDLDVMVWAAVVFTLQLRVEFFFVIIGTCEVRAMHVDDADVEEPALDPQPAHSAVDRPPPNHPLLHLTHHDESCSQLVCIAATLVDGMTIPKRTHR